METTNLRLAIVANLRIRAEEYRMRGDLASMSCADALDALADDIPRQERLINETLERITVK